MGNQEGVEVVLATLPDGARVLSMLLTSQSPPLHVYRVVSAGGRILDDFATLIEVNNFVSLYTAGAC